MLRGKAAPSKHSLTQLIFTEYTFTYSASGTILGTEDRAVNNNK